jgi:hypothetical protein
MPAVSDQIALPGSRTNPELVAARLLLKPGRKYEDAVKTFQPYDKTQEVNEEARKAGAALIVEGERFEPRRKTYIYVNNRLEGNALETISATLEQSSAVVNAQNANRGHIIKVRPRSTLTHIRNMSKDLFDQIREGRTDLVFDYVAASHAATSKDKDGVSLLQWCSYHGDVSAIK